jgi:hypothetical protein
MIGNYENNSYVMKILQNSELIVYTCSRTVIVSINMTFSVHSITYQVYTVK